MELDKKLSIDRILSSVNIAEELYDNDLETIGAEVCDGYDNDCLSRKTWEDNVDKWTTLALQVAESKTFPWPNAANVKYPLITTAALQFSARAYPALIPSVNAVRGRVIGFDLDGSKTERALRIGKHMSYQIFEEMEDWEEEMDRLLFALPIVGCMFKKTYFDSVKGHNVSEIVYPKELVVNYWSKNLEESERVTHVLKMSENDIYERTANGIFIEQELEKSQALVEEMPSNASDDATGADKPAVEDDTLPYIILEQHCYIDLDKDGYKEPYLVVVDYGSKNVLRIVPRFSEEAVQYNEKGKIVSIKPDTYFTKFSFVPSPDGGFYDIGFGILLGPINETINTLINQLLDAGTLSNMQAGFISKGIRIKGGNTSFAPGEWKYANTAGDDLRKGLVPLPVREPSQVLFSLLGMMIESGEKLSSVTEVMTGDIPGQNTKATVAMAAIEQGMKVFSSIYKRIHRSLSKEYKKLFKLNSIFLPEESYFTILDVGQEQAAQIGLQDYNSDDVDVVPTSDPNVATEEQRMAKVQALLEIMPLGLNPEEVKRRYLEATEQPNIEVLMETPEPQPDPQIEFERMKFEDESKRAWKELEIKEEESQTKSLKNIADAEAAEEGQQLDQYLKYMQNMEQQQEAMEKHEQQLDQKEQQHQQKMMHQQQMADQRRQQANVNGSDNQGGVQ